MADCLIEIGTEELPPKALETLARDFGVLVERGLAAQDLAPGAVEIFATPRRLALLLRDTADRQAQRKVEKRGPALAAAFDEDGKPTRAALGFAASCGVGIDALEQRETERGTWLYFTVTSAGASLHELLPQTIQAALADLPVPKRMRWGERSDEFVRPVRWLVVMIDDRVVEMEAYGVSAGRHSHGHRFHAPQPIEIPVAGDYESLLASRGYVIAGFEHRKKRIRELVEESAARLSGEARIDDSLLDEVTALVEYPVAICGEFDEDFLALPAEVLVTTMQENQKYFALFAADGALMPHFIAIANIDSLEPGVVARGNERVIRPRFADARFFYEQDRKRGLDSMRYALDSVVFQEKLGSLGERTVRIIRLAKYIASHTGADQDLVYRAADLCKADLMSDMVGEFPRLQGVIGRYYALLQQEAEPVADAIEQHYWPRHAGDRVPASEIGQAVALADRIDSLVGIFSIGEKPGGDKDPFALRRAALAVLRIVVENRLDLDLEDMCQAAAEGIRVEPTSGDVAGDVIEFVLDRLRGYYQEQGIAFDIVDAVAHDRPGRLYDCDQRIRALQAFQGHEAAAALAAANKRIANILKKQARTGQAVDPALLRQDEERDLFERLEDRRKAANAEFGSGNYLSGLEILAELRPAVDLFFDRVMVMDEDDALRNNRLALLGQLLQSFRQVADFSRIQQ